ncbi:hypothetical protein FBU59_006000 [Linderina macrospora]|uniref:Uncharacterized protein n=1 Tax=Linderina macrospora TaxID=4868 RepID=A0ACC1J191_9FUNG|nr:hypothetical protein FBU59_006000 [Linderina macrospora]
MLSSQSSLQPSKVDLTQLRVKRHLAADNSPALGPLLVRCHHARRLQAALQPAQAVQAHPAHVPRRILAHVNQQCSWLQLLDILGVDGVIGLEEKRVGKHRQHPSQSHTHLEIWAIGQLVEVFVD